MAKKRLKKIGAIFSEAWSLYKVRALPILLVTLVSLLLTVILITAGGTAAFFGLGGEQVFTGDVKEILLNPVVLGTGAAFLLVVPLLISWSQAAILAIAVDQKLGILEALAAGWKYVFSLIWIGSLYCGIIMTGCVLLFIPGLILALSMSFCFYIMIEEDLSGVDAIMASRLYIRGHWWNTLLKCLPVWLISVALSLIPLLGPVFSILFTPFMMLYMVVVYHDLKRVTGKVDPTSCYRWFWVLMGSFGLLLPPLAFIGVIVTVGPQFPEVMERARQEVNQLLGTDVFPHPFVKSLPSPSQSSGSTENGGVPTVRPLPSVDGFVVWRDPIGDAHNPLLDIKEVSAKGEEGELVLNVTLTRSFASYFATADADSFNLLASFYIDTDMNRETGGMPFSEQSERTGYDIGIEVLLVTRRSADNALSGQASVSLYRLASQSRDSLGALEGDAVIISGDSLTIRLPYSLLKISGWREIRVCYREAEQRQDEGLAMDKLVPLK